MKLISNQLYIVSTPIGNLEDITLRALNVLKNSDIILCEDTRRSVKLLNYYKIKKKLISYHKFNEKKQLRNIIEHFKGGKILSLISDAGTPLLSDPGRILVNQCIKNGLKIIFLSSSAVFSGKEPHYTIDQKPNPETKYGFYKLLVEKEIRKIRNFERYEVQMYENYIKTREDKDKLFFNKK